MRQITFFGMHQSKGTPIWQDQGVYNEDTFWEQIDGGRPWTPARKFLLSVPILLYVRYPWRVLGVAVVVALACLLPQRWVILPPVTRLVAALPPPWTVM